MEILSARYGIITGKTTMSGVDVLDKVVIGQKFGNKQLGKDPFSKQKKLLYTWKTEKRRENSFRKMRQYILVRQSTTAPVCKGTGTQTIACIGLGDDPKAEEKSTITCIHCNGKPMSEIE